MIDFGGIVAQIAGEFIIQEDNENGIIILKKCI